MGLKLWIKWRELKSTLSLPPNQILDAVNLETTMVTNVNRKERKILKGFLPSQSNLGRMGKMLRRHSEKNTRNWLEMPWSFLEIKKRAEKVLYSSDVVGRGYPPLVGWAALIDRRNATLDDLTFFALLRNLKGKDITKTGFASTRNVNNFTFNLKVKAFLFSL